MKIKSAPKYDSILKSHLILSKIVFGKDSNAVKYLKNQIKEYGEDHPINIEEREYFAFLKKMNIDK